MAKMGKGKLARIFESGEAELTTAGFPRMLPANLIVCPIERAPVTTFGVDVVGCPLGSPIMREGFTTNTGPILSRHDTSGQRHVLGLRNNV